MIIREQIIKSSGIKNKLPLKEKCTDWHITYSTTEAGKTGAVYF